MSLDQNADHGVMDVEPQSKMNKILQKQPVANSLCGSTAMSSVEASARRRERATVCRNRMSKVGFMVILMGVQLLSNRLVAGVDATCPVCHRNSYEKSELSRRRLQDIENMPISGPDALAEIYALAHEIAARDTKKPVTPSPSLLPPATAPPQSTTSGSKEPSGILSAPSVPPVVTPSLSPTKATTVRPTSFPVLIQHPFTSSPTKGSQSSTPSVLPTKLPSNDPTSRPTNARKSSPTKELTAPPSVSPTKLLSEVPSNTPSSIPTVIPVLSTSPSVQLNDVPTLNPSILPILGSSTPTRFQSNIPSLIPTVSNSTSSPSMVTIVSGNSTSFSRPSSILSCPNEDVKQFIVLPYAYSMETSDKYDVNTVRFSLEQILNIGLAPMLLDCSTAGHRHLLISPGIVAIDWRPNDEEVTTLSCKTNSPNDVCNVFIGSMTLYVREGANITSVGIAARTAIDEVFRVIVVAGLVRVVYLGPDLQSASATLQGTNSVAKSNQVASSASLGSSAIALFVTGSAALVAAMGVFVYLRRKRSSRDASGAATQAAGTDTLGPDYYNDRPTSPFSEMLPSAYRFDHDMNMSAILEADEESQAKSDLIVSEGWVSDTESCSLDIPSSNYSRLNATPVLGARKRQDVPVEPFELCSL